MGQPKTGPALAFDVTHYDATVEPNIAEKTVKGRVLIDLVPMADSFDAIELDIGALSVEAVRDGAASVEFTQGDRRLRILLKPRATKGQKHRLEIAYHGAPRFGLEFVPEKSQTYTIFSTSQWLPCVDAPADRATLRLNLVVPRGLRVVANGRPISTHTLSGARVSHEWRLDQPAPTYTFGFAAGKFNEVIDHHGKPWLRYLSTDASPAQLQQIFANTRDMLAFFEARSGVPYQGGSYTQALVERTIGQELAGFSLMSEEYGQSVLSEPRGLGLIAHEFAHQWWGDSVTCKDWTHFWLNEGFATFMAAAYREARFGHDAYVKDVEAWRARYERVRVAGHDRSLVFPNWDLPTSDDRALVYQKGALVLHELRERLGDRAFWDGIRVYTRAHLGGSVVTADFQRAMEKAARMDLSAFFNQWVYLTD
jgi:aminopeptidase N